MHIMHRRLGEYKMSFHDDLEEWETFHNEKSCPICNDEPPPEDEILVIELDKSWLVTYKEVCLKGTCCLALKPHAIEIYDVSDSDLMQFMKELKVVSKALKEVTNAKKINYEIHGNTVPHLHMHLFPRYMDDPFPNGPIDYNNVDPYTYKDNEFEEFIQTLRKTVENGYWPG